MKDHVELRRGAYADSVTLLQVSRTVQDEAGVVAAQVAMATQLNLEVLTGMGFAVPDAAPDDMVVALRLDDGAELGEILAAVETALTRSTTSTAATTETPPRTTTTALRQAPGAVVLVSVPGAHALVEAMDALDAGSDVMVFSDNVPLEQELVLKRVAAERDLLVMGPDCGTAVIGGLGLGFANVTTPGPVGMVAASGTGCQQLLALLDHAGVGVSSALGVGGRDLSAEIRGISTRTALSRLDADPDVELIVLVSKPPAEDVALEIEQYAASLATPVELALLGPGQPDLTAAAEAVLRRLGRDVPDWPVTGRAHSSAVRGGSVLRGLFVGGTLCEEARLIATDLLGPGAFTMVDFGADELTSGRAHPMIDPTLRLEHLAGALSDGATGAVLLDVVLGHGAEPDPAALLGPAVIAAEVPVVATVVGTAHDPQDLDRQVRVLAETGVEVHLSNARAARRAVELVGGGR
ncbi:MAG TPA: FdrA family protein [Nocardioides sp.]|nr:FdrA family protein [Nocardioides sp.]